MNPHTQRGQVRPTSTAVETLQEYETRRTINPDRLEGPSPRSAELGSSVIVTGCAGFIGSHLVDRLLGGGLTVTGVDNLTTGRSDNIVDALRSPKFTFIEAYIRDRSLVERLDGTADTVYHLAAISSVKQSVEDPIYVNDVNVTGTVNMLDAARRLDASRFVFISSAAVYGRPKRLPVTEESELIVLSPYAASKAAGEKYVQAFGNTYGVETVVLRYFNVYGPRQAYSEYSGVVSIFINRALRNEPIVIDGDGHQTRSLVYVEDVVSSTVAAGEKSQAAGTTLNVAGDSSVTVLELAMMIRAAVHGCTSQVIHGPPRLGDVEESRGDITRLERILGVRPVVSLKEGLRRTVEWYETHRSQ
ncbi:MAG: SDR family NAD(P)-dependent oxidoreductase [Candidatus Thorarchaeota archaeon]|nr:SDR family NAD(P)-dependent oxidoreductase [Candidatus Thorarchaeota archaeon]